MVFANDLVDDLFAICSVHGAGKVRLVFEPGRLQLIEAVLTFEWHEQRYERTAMLDHNGLTALEQLAHLALCVFEPAHRAEYGRILHERRNASSDEEDEDTAAAG